MAKKKIALNVGDIVQIALADGSLCFGRILEEPVVVFYDINVNKFQGLDELILTPILFKVWVMNYAVTSGRWLVIGSLSLEEELKQPVKFFKQDPISKQLTTYINSIENAATYEECKYLERAAVWEPENIEERLRDHFSGTSNQWVESLQIKK